MTNDKYDYDDDDDVKDDDNDNDDDDKNGNIILRWKKGIMETSSYGGRRV